jgi:hypothetical protein
MKYFTPQRKLREWIMKGTLRPNIIDHPMSKFKDKSYDLTKIEKMKAPYFLTNADVPLQKFLAFPDVTETLLTKMKSD